MNPLPCDVPFISLDVAFYFKLGFGRNVGLSLYLDFGGRGFESAS